MKICLLASGSKGNSILVESGQTCLLIDAGLSARELSRRLASVGVSVDALTALLVTHEHTDHIRGLGPLVRQLNLPVYLHNELAPKLPDVGNIDCVREFAGGEHFRINDFCIHPFSITHDSVAPVGFTLSNGSGKIGIATDLGVVTRLVTDCLRGCRALIIESNHDETLLRDGPYPWKLKQRVRSNYGHLSNEASSSLLEKLVWEGLETVFLGHLSEINNRPELAYQAVEQILDKQNLCDPDIFIGKQDAPILWHSDRLF